MNGTIKILLIYIIVCWNIRPTTAQQLIFQDKSYFINGVNLPWYKFGWDFGYYEEEGVSYESSRFDKAFADLAANGVNCIRMWIHCDGRASPEFDENGYVTGLDYNFFEHMDDFLALAAKHELMVILVLWSHDLFEDRREKSGRFAGMHADLLTEEAKLESYLEYALRPMIQRYQNQCNLLAWEIINEPEWAMDIPFGGTTTQVVKATEMQYFVGKCIEVIRAEAPHQMITVGSASLLWNSDVLPQYHNYWSDQVFENMGFNPREVYLDFYAPHYYEWMSSAVSPFAQHISTWELDKPVLLGECRATNDQLSATDRLTKTKEGDYAGILFWSYNAKDNVSNWEGCKDALKAYCMDNPESVRYTENCSALQHRAYKPIYIYPNPVQDLLYFQYHNLAKESIMVYVYNFMGTLVYQHRLSHRSDHQYEVFLGDLNTGLYIFELQLEQTTGGEKQLFCDQIQVY